MPGDTCNACRSSVQPDFLFCPYCGSDLNRAGPKPSGNQSAVEPPPTNGITVEFSYSSSQSFDFAVSEAQNLPGYRKFGDDKKATYRVTVSKSETGLLGKLIVHLRGWRKRVVYVDGHKEPWDTVFAHSYCHEKRQASFNPELYCFGLDNEWQINIWGCIQAGMAFTEGADWLCWGAWDGNGGDWRFDKERIRHGLESALSGFRYCPALQPDLIEDVLSAIPDVVNPLRDRDWKFIESFGNDARPGLRVTIEPFGIRETAIMKGVGPSGRGALQSLAKRLANRFPPIG